jgi:hypothetical protein
MILKQKIPFLINVSTYLANHHKSKPIIYIAGKVTGLPADEVNAKFKAAQVKLEAQGFCVLNPTQFIGNAENWQIAMRMASTLLNMADHIYLLPDFSDSEGARIEFAQATKFGISCINE